MSQNNCISVRKVGVESTETNENIDDKICRFTDQNNENFNFLAENYSLCFNVGNSGLIKGTWSKLEDEALIRFVEKYGTRQWKLAANDLKFRSAKQCRTRWCNNLDPSIKKSPWTAEEERILQEAHREHGNKWAKIAKLLPGRTENGVKNHWHTMRRRKPRNLVNSSTSPISSTDRVPAIVTSAVSMPSSRNTLICMQKHSNNCLELSTESQTTEQRNGNGRHQNSVERSHNAYLPKLSFDVLDQQLTEPLPNTNLDECISCLNSILSSPLCGSHNLSSEFNIKPFQPVNDSSPRTSNTRSWTNFKSSAFITPKRSCERSKDEKQTGLFPLNNSTQLLTVCEFLNGPIPSFEINNTSTPANMDSCHQIVTVTPQAVPGETSYAEDMESIISTDGSSICNQPCNGDTALFKIEQRVISTPKTPTPLRKTLQEMTEILGQKCTHASRTASRCGKNDENMLENGPVDDISMNCNSHTRLFNNISYSSNNIHKGRRNTQRCSRARKSLASAWSSSVMSSQSIDDVDYAYPIIDQTHKPEHVTERPENLIKKLSTTWQRIGTTEDQLFLTDLAYKYMHGSYTGQFLNDPLQRDTSAIASIVMEKNVILTQKIF